MNETPKTKSGWRWPRRILITLAVLATLIALLYAEEDWRGKRAWDNCKRELAAKGVDLNWSDYIPAPVPDDQNFFKSPKMADWFVRGAKTMTNELLEQLTPESLSRFTTNNPVVLAEWTWQPLLTAKNIAAANSENADLVLKYSSTLSYLHTFVEANAPPVSDETPRTPQSYASPDLNSRISRLLQNVVGTNIMIGARGDWLLAKSHAEIKPARIILLSGMEPGPESVAWFTQCFPTNVTGGGSPRIHIEPPMGTIPFPKTFRVILDSAHSAADFLAWSDQAVPDFDLIREALKRPYARMDGDYSKPYEQPIPNFITVRAVAQVLAERAQCYLLLGQPDRALQELTLLHDFRHLLEGAPTGKPMTLVAAMINVAVTGLYVETIAGGLRSHSWQEPQLAALQQQLADINLTPFVFEALQEGPAALCRDAQIAWIPNLFDTTIHATWTTRIVWWFWPSGWTYQNMVNVAVLEQKPLEGFDLADDTVAPRKFDEATRAVVKFADHGIFPFKILAAIAIPNFTKAEQTTAHNQTLVNEAQIVCALERYHLANGEYPETLDALAPQFIEKLPHDIIGGPPWQGSGATSQPLHYRRTDDGKFLLYSVGWNETDDGGKESPHNQYGGITDYTHGDWVWEN
jgi:hypothetical protein